MLLNEIKILRELDKEGSLTGSLSDIGRAFRTGGSADTKAEDIDPKIYPALQKFIAVPTGSLSAPELSRAFGDGEDGEKAAKKALANVKAVLNAMTSVYSLTMNRPEFVPVAKASTLKGGSGFNATDEWLAFIDEQRTNLERRLETQISKMTSGTNASAAFQAIKKVSTAKAFADTQAKGLQKALVGPPPMDPATAAQHAEVFLTMLNMMKLNCDQAIALLS